ncbi:hypothetical protein HXY33_02615 [Candidatus Bathyarchaeota archaeon]|nr:hypothetical protein [Candidatus Bathyarchaeota archaeon]
MKTKKKRVRTKAQTRAKKESNIQKAQAVFLVFTLFIVVLLAYFAYAILNHSSSQISIEPTLQFKPVNQNPKLKAAIVDHLNLTLPNQTFIQTAARILTEANYTVDYYSGEKVTVEFYRNLPTLGYDIILLRVHSAGASVLGESELQLFTSEFYSKTRHVSEQLAHQVGMVMYSADAKEAYFGISPNFVRQCMKDEFEDTIVIMMGCDGLAGTQMANAFKDKGAKAYIGWNTSISSSRTDTSTMQLLKHLITEKKTIKQALAETMQEVDPDPFYRSTFLYYPLEVGNQTIEAEQDSS